jgi:electron transfer flavoprotein alpha subunit
MKVLILAIKMSKDNLLELNQAALDITNDSSKIDMYLFDYENTSKEYNKLQVNELNIINLGNLPPRKVEGYKNFINGLQILEYDAIILGNNITSKQVAISIAARKHLPILSSITKINQVNPMIVEKDIYSNNLIGRFEIEGKVVLTIANGIYEKIKNPNGSPVVNEIKVNSNIRTDWIINSSIKEKISKNSLQDSNHLIVAGRGVGSKENFCNLVSLANQTSFNLGVTRPIYWNGWVSKNMLVGASGFITSAKLALVFGASGSSPFMVGVRNSEVIIAINKDSRAPIFKHVDVGIVEDANEIINELRKIIEVEENSNTF